MTTDTCTRCGQPASAHPGQADLDRSQRSAPLAADRLALAVNVRRARKTSQCTACGCPILVGQSIARLTSPGEWIHTACIPHVAAITRRDRRS